MSERGDISSQDSGGDISRIRVFDLDSGPAARLECSGCLDWCFVPLDTVKGAEWFTCPCGWQMFVQMEGAPPLSITKHHYSESANHPPVYLGKSESGQAKGPSEEGP